MCCPDDPDAIGDDERGGIDGEKKLFIALSRHHKFGVDGDDLLAGQRITSGTVQGNQLLDSVECLLL